MAVAAQNGLLANSKPDRPAWVSIVQQHYKEDMQYQPWHRGDKQGILAHSVTVLMQMLESQQVEFRCIPATAFDAFRRQHNNNPVHVVMCSASGKLMLQGVTTSQSTSHWLDCMSNVGTGSGQCSSTNSF